MKLKLWRDVLLFRARAQSMQQPPKGARARVTGDLPIQSTVSLQPMIDQTNSRDVIYISPHLHGSIGKGNEIREPMPLLPTIMACCSRETCP